MNVLGVFAKHWARGQVKTRLAARLGEDAACELYHSFLQRTLERFTGVADRRVIVYSPPESRPAFEGLKTNGWELAAQASGDLGNRLRSFFEETLQGDSRAVIVGSDSPTLPLDYVRSAFDALREHAVVLGPATDGGYYLVGAARSVPPIFDGIAWSTADVWRQTTARLDQSHTPYAVLPEWYDVDEADDLRRLCDELAVLAEHDSAWRPMWATVSRAVDSL